MNSKRSTIAEGVAWSAAFDRPNAHRGEEIVLRIRAEIARGYHLYSVSQPPGGPLPTSITAPAGFPVARIKSWPEPMRLLDPKFAIETERHVGSVLFDVSVLIDETLPEGSHDAVFKIRYQLCDEHTCLRPEAKELCARIRVEAAKPATTNIVKPVTSALHPSSSEYLTQQLFANSKTWGEFEAGVKEILKEDPKFVRGYIILARKPAERGDVKRQRALLRAGLAANPGNDALHYELASCAKASRRRLFLNRFVHRFRKSPYASIALQELAGLSTSRNEARKILERVQKSKANQLHAVWTERELYPMLAESDPDRVVRLLRSASRRAANSTDFVLKEMTAGLLDFYTMLLHIQRLLKEGRSRLAVAASRRLREPDIPHVDVNEEEEALVALIGAKALVADGQVEQAYKLLIRHPLTLRNDEMLGAASHIGTRFHKSRRTVANEVWQKVLEQPYPIGEFTIRDKRNIYVRARDYRSQVLLVNVWNPG